MPLPAPYKASSENLSSFDFTFEAYPDHSHPNRFSTHRSHEECDSQSLSESVLTFEEENGRTYHGYKAGSYLYPNDADERERLEFQHKILKDVLHGRNYLAPFSKEHPPRKVLDIGTGTGTWAIEMGDEFPWAEVVGVDLSPIQTELVPPNVHFFIDDCNNPVWDQPRDFDYIHTRLTLGSWKSMKDNVIQRAFDHLEPGGYLECQEVLVPPFCDDGTMPDNFAFLRWVYETNAALVSHGNELFVGDQMKRWLTEVGFVDVEERTFMLPLNPWPSDPFLKNIGGRWLENMKHGLTGFTVAPLNRIGGRSLEEIAIGLVDVRKDLSDENIHAYQKFFVVWGRKPGPSPTKCYKLRP